MLWCILGYVVAGWCIAVGSAAWAAQPWNILFIAVDDLRPELHCYGVDAVQSPAIDGIAAAGTLFNRAYCQQALCHPTRFSLLTGRRPDATGIYDFKYHIRDKMPDVITLPQLFKEHGWHTQAFGKIFHTGKEDAASWSVPHYESQLPQWQTPEGVRIWNEIQTEKVTKRLFDISSGTWFQRGAQGLPYEAPDVPDDALREGDITVKALDALEQVKDKPFFLAVGYYKPHIPFVAPKKYWDLYDPDTIPPASNPFFPIDAPFYANFCFRDTRGYYGSPESGPLSPEQARAMKHGYYACISYVDAQIQRLLDVLNHYGLRDRTIVILWGDHGYQLGEHALWDKHTNYETSARVPLIISVPGQKAAGIQSTALVEFVDIYPTLAGLCGLPMPDSLEGISFAPLLDEPDRPWKSAAFTQFPRTVQDRGEAMGYAMRTDRYRFVEWRLTSGEVIGYELYDHTVDPEENFNIADRPENASVIRRLAEQLQAGWQAALPPR